MLNLSKWTLTRKKNNSQKPTDKQPCFCSPTRHVHGLTESQRGLPASLRAGAEGGGMRVCLPHCKAFVLLRSGITLVRPRSCPQQGREQASAPGPRPPRRGCPLRSAPLPPAGSRAVGCPGRERAAGGVGVVSTRGSNSRPSLHRLHVSCSIPAIHSCPRNFTFPPLPPAFHSGRDFHRKFPEISTQVSCAPETPFSTVPTGFMTI